LDLSEEAKLAVRDTLGEVFSEPVSLLEVVWFEPRDSTDQEERSSDLKPDLSSLLIEFAFLQTYVWTLLPFNKAGFIKSMK
jgi:hypothetical protein